MNTLLTANHMPDLIEAFVDDLRTRGKAARTVSMYKQTLCDLWVYLRRDGGAPVLEQLSPATLEAFLDASGRRGGPISARTWNLRRSVLSSFYTYLHKQGRVRTKPTDLVPPRKVARHAVQTLTFEELLSLLDVVDYHSSSEHVRARNRAILMTFMYSGIRLSELVSLDLDQVDLDGHRFIGMTRKGGHEDHVTFSDLAAEAIEAYLSVRAEVVAPRETALFLTTRATPKAAAGTRLSQRSVQAILARLARRAGIERSVHPHLMRHTFATGMLRSGCDLPTLQEQLGHSSATTTLRYTHSDDTRRREAVDRYEAEHKKRARRKRSRKSAKISHGPAAGTSA